MPSWPPFLENGIAGAEEGLDCLWHNLQIQENQCSLYMILRQIPGGAFLGRRIKEVQQKCKSSVYMISFFKDVGRRPASNFRDNCNWLRLPLSGKKHTLIPNSYRSPFSPSCKWDISLHLRPWLPSTWDHTFPKMAVGTALCGAPKVLACFDDGSAKRDSSASPWPCLDLFWPIPHDKFEVSRLWLCAGNLNWNKFTQRSWRLRKQRFGLQSLSSWENTIPFSSSFLRCTQGHFLYMFVWWKADGGCLVV